METEEPTVNPGDGLMEEGRAMVGWADGDG